ncbi:MAG: hypothetical protein SFX73_33010 [Kofleriaceae bacterium]|nr:hypothetical protein [Kofleriaceae bacterium]
MKALALLALCAAGCESRPEGRYLFVDGDARGIEFDRVELIFGKPIGDALPFGVPGYVTSLDGTEELMKRVEVGAAGGELAETTTTQVDLYLASGDAERVGEYVLVIAYLGDEPRGIGEVRNFGQDWADITRYQVVLAPFPTDSRVFGRWGAAGELTGACVRWTRDGLTTAIVPDGDRDCDGYADAGVDCDPSTYCSGGATCTSDVPCVSDVDGCSIGACVNSGSDRRVCTPTVCLPTAACPACEGAGNANDVIRCVLESTATHGDDLRIPVRPDQTLCTVPYEFFLELPDGAVCLEGPIEMARIYQSDAPVPFLFYATPITGGCKIKMEPVAQDAIFEGIYHVLVKVSAGTGATPRSIVVGMQPELKACGGVLQVIPPVYLEGCP